MPRQYTKQQTLYIFPDAFLHSTGASFQIKPEHIHPTHSPAPLACTTLSGIRSLPKCAIVSRNITSWRSMGPLGPAVRLDVMSAIGTP